MIHGITAVWLPGPGFDSCETLVGAQHRQAVAPLQFPGESVNASADWMTGPVDIKRIPDDERLRLPLGNQCSDSAPIRSVIAYRDDFQRSSRFSQSLAYRNADSFCAEVETQQGSGTRQGDDP